MVTQFANHPIEPLCNATFLNRGIYSYDDIVINPLQSTCKTLFI